MFAVYVIGVVAMGCWFVRSSDSTKEFMAAGGSLPGWAVGLSIFGTFLSSNTFLGVPGKTYGTNFNAFVFSLTLPLAAWIATRYFVPFYRNSGEISAYHHFEVKFGNWARTYAVVCYLLTQIARMGAILFGVALGLYALTGWDVPTIIVLTGILVTVYTLLGGIEAVIWTDVVQSIVLMGGAVLIFGMLLAGMPEGPGQAFAIAAEQGKFSLGSWMPDFTTSTVWVMLLYGLFINLNNFGIDQSYVQRYHTAKTIKSARGALWLGALMYVPISLLFFVIGAVLFSYYETHPEMKHEVQIQVATDLPPNAADLDQSVESRAALLTDAQIGDKVLPHFISTHLPPGMAGLMIAAIFAAAMSSVDTSLNSSATIILKDIYERYFNPEPSEKAAMRVLRVATVVTGIIGTGTALAMIGVESILQAWWTLQGIFAGGLLGLFLIGMIVRQPSKHGAMLAVTIGLLVISWMTFSTKIASLPPYLQNPLHANMTIVVGTLTIFLIGILTVPRPQPDSSAHSTEEVV
ncbi:sodium:solute symporter [Rubinisphaera margarita]|uniref:sodium:solute symporter n=1 Tax=Rubinisphaera margarita TaxID=2909586 RepID=UPI001EE8AEDA|nr:sodium:solute symporter [Rubinisphaera margarita]MCG6155734.1 sodium:solute symporter [Rubinisphaera margarita]